MSSVRPTALYAKAAENQPCSRFLNLVCGDLAGFLGRGIGPSQGLRQHRTTEIYLKNAVPRMRFKPTIPLVAADGVRLGCAVTVIVSPWHRSYDNISTSLSRCKHIVCFLTNCMALWRTAVSEQLISWNTLAETSNGRWRRAPTVTVTGILRVFTQSL